MAPQKIVLYTCIFNNHDIIKPLRVKDDFDYVLFTDNKLLQSKYWEINYVENQIKDPVRAARYYKHHPIQLFPNHDISIWLDATHYQIKSIKELLNCENIAAMKHFSFSNLNQELEACVLQKKDNEEIMRKQFHNYISEGLPNHLEHFTTTCLVRKHNDKILKLQNIWWQQISQFSRRDQLSFSYSLWKTGITCETIKGYCRSLPHTENTNHSDYFNMVKHGKTLILL